MSKNNSIIKSSGGSDDDKRKRPRAVSGVVRNGPNKGKTIVFKAVNDEFSFGPPAHLKPTPAQRVTLYQRIRREMEARAAAPNVVGDKCAFDIPWHFLTVDPDWGRKKIVSWDQVATLQQYFDAGSLTHLTVVMRALHDDNGNVVDALFEVTDGNHRRLLLTELFYRDKLSALLQLRDALRLPCSVGEGETAIDAARSFINTNERCRLNMATADKWRGRVAENETKAMTVVRLASRFGFDARCDRDTKRNWKTFNGGGGIIERMIDEPAIGRDAVERVLALAANEQNEGLASKDFTKSQNFAGLCFAIAFFERPGFMHDLGLRQLFSSPRFFEDLAAQVARMTDSDVKVMFGTALPTVKTIRSDEMTRFFKIAAAIAHLYSIQVPEPHAREAVWRKCPSELRKLMHNARRIVNENEQRAYVAKLQSKLIESRRAEPYWRVDPSRNPSR